MDSGSRQDHKQAGVHGAYTAHHLRIIETEPIDILANPLFLPEQFQNELESLWTDERTGRIIRAAVRNRVAFEINTRFRLPGLKFLRRAKAAGAKFSFGSNIMAPGSATCHTVARWSKSSVSSKSIFSAPRQPAGSRFRSVRSRAERKRTIRTCPLLENASANGVGAVTESGPPA